MNFLQINPLENIDIFKLKQAIEAYSHQQQRELLSLLMMRYGLNHYETIDIIKTWFVDLILT